MSTIDKTVWLNGLEVVYGNRRLSCERLCYNSIVPAVAVTLRGRLGDSSVQQMQINHVVSGKVVFLDVVPVSRGVFSLPLKLYRGRNDIVCLPFDASGRAFSVTVVSKGFWREWIETLVCAVIFALIIKTFVVQPFFIPSPSMEDTLKAGDRIMVSRVEYLFDPPRRRDIMVFEAPNRICKYFIKRVIGEPGEKVSIVDKTVYVKKGESIRALKEPYVKFDRGECGFSSLDNYRDLPVVPDNGYFVMGDNRDRSADSRFWGPVFRHKIVGRAVFIWWPWSRAGWLR